MATSKKTKSPAALGFRMPAEWERQQAIWLSWPRRPKTWPGLFRQVPAAYSTYVAAISRYEEVRLNCEAWLQPRVQRYLVAAGTDLTRVRFFDHANNDAWCRDHGPIFVKHDGTGEVAVTDWTYNAWGGKYPPFEADNAIPRRIAQALKLRRFGIRMVLEGGSIDVNGQGALLTSEQCLLNPNRNPHLSRGQIEQQLRDNLGVRDVLWLGDGLVGDDTDGHIDDMTRFIRRDTIVTCVETNPRDANYRALAANRERLDEFRAPRGRRYQIVELPMPAPVVIRGRRVPASYANFLIGNGAVFVPVFGQPKRDAKACGLLRDCFPGREIVPIDCSILIWGLGTLHCLSQQQPA